MKLKTLLVTTITAMAALTQTGLAMPAAPLVPETKNPMVQQAHGDVYWRRGRPYWNGYPGYPSRRPGYNFYGGFWFPNSAFGIIITPQPRYRTYRNYRYYEQPVEPTYQLTPAHYRWCESRYRSYRRYDNTYQPYNGPRKQCVSPYLQRIR